MSGELPRVAAQGFQRIAPKQRLRRNGSISGHATVSKTGRAPLNVGATGILMELARMQGLEPNAFAVRLGVQAGTGIITVEPVTVGSAEAAAVRLDRAKKTATLYLADIFDALPDLRPQPARRCPAVKGLDPEGRECLLIALLPSLTA